VGNFDQFWAETLGTADGPERQGAVRTTVIDRPPPRPLPVPPPRAAVQAVAVAVVDPPVTVAAPPVTLGSPPVVLPATPVAVRAAHSPRRIRTMTAAVVVAVVVGTGVISVGRQQLPLSRSGGGTSVSTPRTLGAAPLAAAGPSLAEPAKRLTSALRAGGADRVVTAAYSRQGARPVLLVAGRGELERAYDRLAVGLAGADGAVGLSGDYRVRGTTVRCGDVTAAGRAGVLCVWSGRSTGAVWSPSSARVGSVAALAAEAAPAVR
jgi:hypothetical protein